MPFAVRIALLAALFATVIAGCGVETTGDDLQPPNEQVSSRIVNTDAGELILIQEVYLQAPVEEVWKAYTTADGWTAWASPRAEIDLRVGGTIRTSYEGEIGGINTITLHIVNYVPHKLLTLKTDVSNNWPEAMKNDADKLSNVILFESVANGHTQIQSFGIGYTDTPEYQRLMEFFMSANEGLFANLKAYLESGTRFRWGT